MSFVVILKKPDIAALFSIVVALTILGTTGCAGWNKTGDSTGRAKVKKERNRYFVDRSGWEAVLFVYEGVRNFSGGLAMAKRDGKYGFVDRSGREAVPFIYEGGRDFSGSLAWVKKDGKWGAVDPSGR